jgi:hypothetical protein
MSDDCPNPSPDPHLVPIEAMIGSRAKVLKRVGLVLLTATAFTLVVAAWNVVHAPTKPGTSPIFIYDVTQLNPIHVGMVITPTTTQEIIESVKRHSGPISVGARGTAWEDSLSGFRLVSVTSERDAAERLSLRLERRGVRRYTCIGCGRRTGRVRSANERSWDDLPWASHRVTLIYLQRRLRHRHCGIRTERIEFADSKARVTRRLRQLIGLDCRSSTAVAPACRRWFASDTYSN